MSHPILATSDLSPMVIVAIVGVAILGAAYFAVRFWLVSTRPPNIKDVQTPNLDRINRDALAHLGDEDEEEDDDEAPAELRK